MNLYKIDIEKLDFIIDKLVETGQPVCCQHLINAGLIDKQNNNKSELEFQRLITFIEHYNVAKVTHSNISWDTVAANKNTHKFKEDGGFKNIIQEELNKRKKEEEIETLSVKKLKSDTKLSKWQVKTFWFVFIFGLFGFIFGIYNFIENLNKKELIEELKQDNQDTQEEVSRLRTLILDQKTVYPLHSSKTQIDSLNVTKNKQKND